MPKEKILGPFIESFDDDTLNKNIAEIRTYLEQELADIDSLKNTTLQNICMFALIDCLAQEEANYPWDSSTAFRQFVLKYQKQCNYMEKVEPVTLYYHIEELIEEAPPYSGAVPEKIISLDDLGYVFGVKVEEILAKSKSKEILDYLEKKQGKSFAKKKASEHQFISLVYRMRSKAVHEMSGLGESWTLRQSFFPTTPFYRNCSRTYVKEKNIVSDDAIELVIPTPFIRSILVDCINGYLNECKVSKRFPFCNNDLARKVTLSWYDR